ncbi:MAG: hypothetical protein MUD01_14215 [Chloroflexaceae bacterium]|jgi:hypothetical protein|nr:hypothetical protein [Chloroflexaceae bacterium]
MVSGESAADCILPAYPPLEAGKRKTKAEELSMQQRIINAIMAALVAGGLLLSGFAAGIQPGTGRPATTAPAVTR